MKQAALKPDPRIETAAPKVALAEAAPADAVLALQRTAGNASVTAWLARDPAPAAAAPALPSADVLTSRISNCIGVWETNRGGDAPSPTESSLDTLATVKASMATIEQATMPYALDALRKYASLRKLASPELTKEEINDAIARDDRGQDAARRGQDGRRRGARPPTTSSRPSRARSRRPGSATTTCARCSAGSSSRRRSTRKHGHVGEGKGKDKKTGKSLAEEIPEADRLGLGTGSLSAYIKDPKKWGENRAAWQRLAVDNMPGEVGARINSVATSSGGTALAGPVVKARVDAELAKDPKPSEEELVKTVGAKNNANETGYGDNIWATYQRLYP